MDEIDDDDDDDDSTTLLLVTKVEDEIGVELFVNRLSRRAAER